MDREDGKRGNAPFLVGEDVDAEVALLLLHELDVGELHGRELRDVVVERGDRVREGHSARLSGAKVVGAKKECLPRVIVTSARAHLDTNAGGTPDVDQRFDAFQTKPDAVFDGSTPLVCALV